MFVYLFLANFIELKSSLIDSIPLIFRNFYTKMPYVNFMGQIHFAFILLSSIYCFAQNRIHVDQTNYFQIQDNWYNENQSDSLYRLKDSSPITGIIFLNYKNGKPNFEIECIDGKEIRSMSWAKNGRIISKSCEMCSDTTSQYFIFNKTNKRLKRYSAYYYDTTLKCSVNIEKKFFRNSRIKFERNVGNSNKDVYSEKRWYRNGKMESTICLMENEDGTFNSEVMNWYEDGTLRNQYFRKNGQNHGNWIGNYSNGQRRSEINYENGRRIGWQRSYSKSGKLRGEVELIDGPGILVEKYGKNKYLSIENFANGYPEGIQQFWFYNSKKLSNESYYSNGKKNGLQREWFENGKLKIESNYRDDLLHGNHKEWYKNGKMKLEENYIDGKKEGLCKEWYENGNVKSISVYKDDKLNGNSIERFEDGILRSVVNYKNGEKEGPEKKFYINGFVMSDGNYKNGKKDGNWIYYHGYAENKISSESTWIDGEIQGIEIKRNAKGQITHQFNFVDGKEHGPFSIWHDNGKQKIQGHCEIGKMFLDKCWDSKGNVIDCSQYNWYR